MRRVLPFQADSAQETMIKRLTDDPMPLQVARPDIVFPPTLQAVLDKALARAPAERYGNASQFGKDAEAAVAEIAAAGKHMESAATQLMEAEAARKAAPAKPKAPPPTAVAVPAATPAPAKRSMLVPILGGVGGVAVLAVIGYVAMNGGKKPSLAAADSLRTVAPASRPSGPDTQKTGAQQPGSGTRTASNTPASNPRTVAQPPRQAQPGPGGAPSAADSLRLGNEAFDNNQFDVAVRLGSWVYGSPSASNTQRASAAKLVATVYVGQSNTPQALVWYHNVLRFAPSDSGARNMIAQLGAQP